MYYSQLALPLPQKNSTFYLLKLSYPLSITNMKNNKSISRRNFLATSGAALAGSAFVSPRSTVQATVAPTSSVSSVLTQASYKSKYPDIPIVDIHTHTSGARDAANLLKVSETIKQKYGSNLAFWIGLADLTETVEEVKAACNNRMLFAVSEMRPHKGLTVTADEVIAKVRQGYVGLKFWYGAPFRVLEEGERGIRMIDDVRFSELFDGLERGNILLASAHIADRNEPFGDRKGFMTNPVEFWTHIRAFENVLIKHPRLTVVAAHGCWLVLQDAQIDYLRYMLSTYPNLYIDLSATYQYIRFANPENLRDLYIEYQDRVLYGTDGGRVADNEIDRLADRYVNTFAILETDQTVMGSFFDNKPIQGLNLPKEVLEKIYYKNALKLYPGLKEAMK